MTAKFEAFIEALEALCREHGCQIATSMYDGIDIWDLKEDREPICCAGIEDYTDY